MPQARPQPSLAAIRKLTRVLPGKPFRLSDRVTLDDSLFAKKADALASLATDTRVIDTLQDALYADGRRALLIVLQGMDTAGKSGVIKSVFSRTSPLGMMVKAFKAPTSEELSRDFLWRVHHAIPPRGHIGIFDRSHYEDVLVVRVRGLVSPETIERRYGEINAFEKHLTDNGVTILKIMLHMSRDVQGERLRDRLEAPHKRWKFNPGDLDDRAHWDEFMRAYELMVERCSMAHAPWHVIPSDSKSRRNAICARLIRDTLEKMDPTYPDPGIRPEDHPIS